MTQYGINLTQRMPNTNEAGIKLSWLLLDSCSTMSGANNANVVSNIHTVGNGEHMRVISTGGHCDYTQKANLKLFDLEVFFNAKSLANILSLKDVANKYRVTMDTSDDKSMTVWA